MVKPKGRTVPRETRSQLSQLESHPHGNEKGVKWPMDVKDGSSPDLGSVHDTGQKGKSPLSSVQRALDSDKNLSGYGLKVGEINNRVEVTGIVDTVAEKDHLYKLLAENGVSKFADGVSISTDGKINDKEIALEVREELEAEPGLSEKGISVESVAGTVFLAGEVDSRRQEELAISTARKARGVTRVVSHLNYLPGDMDLDTIFHSQVNNENRWKH